MTFHSDLSALAAYLSLWQPSTLLLFYLNKLNSIANTLIGNCCTHLKFICGFWQTRKTQLTHWHIFALKWYYECSYHIDGSFRSSDQTKPMIIDRQSNPIESNWIDYKIYACLMGIPFHVASFYVIRIWLYIYIYIYICLYRSSQ